MATELKLPDVGDNIEKGTVVTVLVKAGDTVAEGDPIIEIETDKAVIEVPASAGGTVEAVSVNVGDTVSVGGTILTLSGGGSEAPAAPAAAPAQAEAPEAGAPKQQQAAAPAPAASAPAQSGGSTEVKLPDVGDNIERGTVVTVLVNVGDTVAEGDPVIEIETDKAVIEVPSSAGGTVQSIGVAVGDTVNVGGTILTLSGGSTGGSADASSQLPASQGGGNETATVESSTTAGDAETANRVAQAQQESQKAQAAPQGGQSAPAQTNSPQATSGNHDKLPSCRRGHHPGSRRTAALQHPDLRRAHGGPRRPQRAPPGPRDRCGHPRCAWQRHRRTHQRGGRAPQRRDTEHTTGSHSCGWRRRCAIRCSCAGSGRATAQL